MARRHPGDPGPAVRQRVVHGSRPWLPLPAVHGIRQPRRPAPLPSAPGPPEVPGLGHRQQHHAARVRLLPQRRGSPSTEGVTMAVQSNTQLAPDQRLAKGALTLPDAIAISVSVIAPGMAAFLNVPGVAATAGGSTPLAFLLGGIACLALAFVVIGFTRRMASAGYAYTYVSRSLGKSWGFLAGWLYFFAFACFVPMTMAGVGWLFSDLVGVDPQTWWFPFFLVGMGVLVLLSIVRISVTTKVQLLVGVATVLVLLVFALIVTGKGGVDGQSLQPFMFSHTASGGFHGVFYGLIFGVTSFIGFESAADFGEETANPRRAVPIAILASVIFAIVFYVFITYATTIGYGVDQLQKDPTPWVAGGLVPVAEKFG